MVNSFAGRGTGAAPCSATPDATNDTITAETGAMRMMDLSLLAGFLHGRFLGPAALGRRLGRSPFRQQALDQRLQMCGIPQRPASLRGALLADHAFPVDHHDLRHADPLQLRNPQIVEHRPAGRDTDRKSRELLRVGHHLFLGDVILESYAQGLEAARTVLGIELGKDSGEVLAMGTPRKQKLHHHNLAFEARKRDVLPLRCRNREVLGRARYRRSRLNREAERNQQSQYCRAHKRQSTAPFPEKVSPRYCGRGRRPNVRQIVHCRLCPSQAPAKTRRFPAFSTSPAARVDTTRKTSAPPRTSPTPRNGPAPSTSSTCARTAGTRPRANAKLPRDPPHRQCTGATALNNRTPP